MKKEPKIKPDMPERSYTRLSSRTIKNIQVLARRGLSLDSISAQLCIPKTTVYYHARKYCKKMTHMNMAVLSEIECGYLVGMFVGDGCFIVKPKDGTYITKFTLDATRDEDISGFLQNMFWKTRKKVGRRIERGSIALRIHSKDFVEFLSRYVKCIKQSDSPRNIKVLTNREKWTTLFKLGFIGGLIDSDGHVYSNQKRTRPSRVVIKTINENLKEDIAKILFSLGIQATTYTAKPYEGSYSTNLRHVIYIPSVGLKKIVHKILAVKLERYERE